MENVPSPAPVQIPDDLAERLSDLARTMDRTESDLVAQAIEEFVTVQEWHVRAIQEGIAAADRGEVLGHDVALRELNRWKERAS